ncbi:hypothetical protein F53441_11034 [Fusarium austroafricanum]|uniref:Alpha/beta hydrolase n=1 Tax=Fusarium austroafricanum TaxID=2364996 RepID=A0A8H4NNH0_9HYPO|nr:hypothetical protein F53441_11034 [Fusarium austroafricanum]
MALAMPPFVISMFTDSLTEADSEWALAQNRKISGKNATALVIDHAFPLLVIASESYTFMEAEKGSHFMIWENPKRLNSIVKRFIIS